MAVRCRRPSPVGFSMAETLSERPCLVRPLDVVPTPPLKACPEFIEGSEGPGPDFVEDAR
jgi:hypothetical protein